MEGVPIAIGLRWAIATGEIAVVTVLLRLIASAWK
jgi:hypothetical protein